MSVDFVSSKSGVSDQAKTESCFSLNFYKIKLNNCYSFCERIALKIANFIMNLFDCIARFFVNKENSNSRIPHYNPNDILNASLHRLRATRGDSEFFQEFNEEHSENSIILEEHWQEALRNKAFNATTAVVSDTSSFVEQQISPPEKKRVGFTQQNEKILFSAKRPTSEVRPIAAPDASIDLKRDEIQKQLSEIRSSIPPDELVMLGQALARVYATVLFPDPPSKHKRSYPLMSGKCTMNLSKVKHLDLLTPREREVFQIYIHSEYANCTFATRLMSAYLPQHSFKDCEIMEVLPIDNQQAVSSPFFKGMLQGTHYVIQQNGIRGCVEACACMIASDRLGKFVEPEVTNLGNNETLKQMIQSCSLNPKELKVNNFEELQEALTKDGPAAISVETIGAHEIVVDAVLDQGVQIRDPWHGWAVIVSKPAFENSAKFPFSIIQAIQ